MPLFCRPFTSKDDVKCTHTRDKNQEKKKKMRVFHRNATTLNALKGFSEPRAIVLKMLLL